MFRKLIIFFLLTSFCFQNKADLFDKICIFTLTQFLTYAELQDVDLNLQNIIIIEVTAFLFILFVFKFGQKIRAVHNPELPE